MKKYFVILLLLVTAIISFNCSAVQQLVNISRLKYKVDGVSDYKLMGIIVANKKSISDFSYGDIPNLINAVSKGSMPASFNLNILAQNPNDGGGYAAQDLDITDFKWRLFIDNVETVGGNIAQPIKVPGTGQSTKFALAINIDLLKFFKDKGYEGVVNLALKLGGVNKSSSNIKLLVKPTVKTMLGNLTTPNEIEIIDFEYR